MVVVFLRKSAFGGVGEFMPTLPLGAPNSGNHACEEHTNMLREHLDKLSLWAYEMLDSTAKSSTGVLRGSVFDMGDFDQCITAQAPFQTKYCLATVMANIPKPQEPRKDPKSLEFGPNESVLKRLYKYEDKTQQSRNVINLGWCVPASCSVTDLEASLNDHLKNQRTLLYDYNVTYLGQINELFCQTEQETTYFDGLDIAFCVVTALILLLVLLGSFLDFKTHGKLHDKIHKLSMRAKMTLAFSVRKNFLDLTKVDEKNKALKILYGIKTLAICFIIMDHRFGTFTSSAILNFDFVERQYRSPLACFIFHGDLFVDTFFIFSGLLVTYGLLSQFEKRKVSPIFIIVLRYIRLTPVYAFVIFYYATLFNHTGSGPLWKLIAGGDSNDCRANWWTNLLYISNYVNPDHMCMTHSWYLPCDFHYFIIAIIICTIINKQKKLGLYTLLVVIIISLIIPFVLTIVYERPAMLFFYPDFLTNPKAHVDFLLTYSKSHTRATPYFVGMFSGYAYYKLKGTNYHIPMTKSILILIISLILLFACILTGAIFYNPYHEYNAVEAGAYASLHRLAWAIGSVGLLHISSYGHAKPLMKFLTWGPWIPLSKLIYGAYLSHMNFQLRGAANFMNARKIGYFDTFTLALADMVIAFFCALMLYLAIEAPLRNIFKELLTPSRPPPTEKEMVEQEPVMNSIESMVKNTKDTTSRL